MLLSISCASADHLGASWAISSLVAATAARKPLVLNWAACVRRVSAIRRNRGPA
jgi:hypothetical protein